jgi:hypothetical protein
MITISLLFGFFAPVALKWVAHLVSLLPVELGDRKLCMVRITGEAVDNMLNELWRSGHSVLNVLRSP